MSLPPFAPLPRDVFRTSPIWNQRRRPRAEGEALVELYMMATHTPYSWSSPHGIDELSAREFVASLRFLAERWKWSKDRVARFLARCEKARHITRQRQGYNGMVYRVEGLDSYRPDVADAHPEIATETSPPVRTLARQIIEDEKRETQTRGTRKRGARPDYPPEFGRTWDTYPHREGSNDKRAAFRAWGARRRAGVAPDEMHAGTVRYRAYCEARDQIGTPYVMQGARFYGKSEPFREAWTVNTPGQNGAAPVAVADVPGARNAREAAWFKQRGY